MELELKGVKVVLMPCSNGDVTSIGRRESGSS